MAKAATKPTKKAASKKAAVKGKGKPVKPKMSRQEQVKRDAALKKRNGAEDERYHKPVPPPAAQGHAIPHADAKRDLTEEDTLAEADLSDKLDEAPKAEDDNETERSSLDDVDDEPRIADGDSDDDDDDDDDD